MPTPTTTPVFASDEEALAAAEEAYRAYLAVADQIFAEGGADPARLADVATGDQLVADIAGFDEVRNLGQHSVGETHFRDTVLQRYDPATKDHAVTLYLCEDVSQVDVFDATGVSIVSADRPAFVMYEVAFDFAPTTTLLVSDKQAWEAGC